MFVEAYFQEGAHRLKVYQKDKGGNKLGKFQKPQEVAVTMG